MSNRETWNIDILTVHGQPDKNLLDNQDVYRYVGRNGAYLQIEVLGKTGVLASLGYIEDGEPIMLQCRTFHSTTSTVARHLLRKIGVLNQVAVPLPGSEQRYNYMAQAQMRYERAAR